MAGRAGRAGTASRAGLGEGQGRGVNSYTAHSSLHSYHAEVGLVGLGRQAEQAGARGLLVPAHPLHAPYPHLRRQLGSCSLPPSKIRLAL